MSRTNIIFISVAFAAFGVYLYKKYIKKDQGKPNAGRTSESLFSSSSSSKDDDYEPYMKK